MKRRKKLIVISIMMVAIILQSSMCLMAKSTQSSKMDIVQIAQGNKDLTTLVEAFQKLPNGTLEDLLKPENKSKLVDILTYHVKAGKTSSQEAMKLNGQDILMLNGKPAKIEVKNGNLYIDGAKVIVKDIQAKNGIIHIIDAVMLP